MTGTGSITWEENLWSKKLLPWSTDKSKGESYVSTENFTGGCTSLSMADDGMCSATDVDTIRVWRW